MQFCHCHSMLTAKSFLFTSVHIDMASGAVLCWELLGVLLQSLVYSFDLSSTALCQEQRRSMSPKQVM